MVIFYKKWKKYNEIQWKKQKQNEKKAPSPNFYRLIRKIVL